MRMTLGAPAGVVALAGLLLAAGCGLGPGSADGSTAAQRGRTSQSAPAAPANAAASAADLEVADRAAVEQAWARFQVLYPNLATAYPKTQWPAKVAELAADPIKKQVLTAAAANLRRGLTGYGSAVPHPYWHESIAGKSTAVMGDCLDASRAGSIFTRTGQKRTVGVARSSIRAYFVRGGDGKWRVRQIAYHVDETC